LPGVECVAFATPGKVALWQEGETVDIGAESEATIGVEIRAGGRRALYATACANVSAAMLAKAEGVDALFFDGTTFTDDELIAQGLLHKTASRMGHVPMSGSRGSLSAFANVKIAHKIYVHINNSNPALIVGSAERAAVEAAGWTIGYDGLELTL
jgi:pyrroloquinoline quinone biosynthesis protein B